MARCHLVDGICITCDPVGLDEMSRALVDALDEIERVRHVRTAAGVAKYGLPIGSVIGGGPGPHVPDAPHVPDVRPPVPTATPKAGRKTVRDRLIGAIDEHLKGGGTGDPLADFSRPQLLKVAKERGIKLDRGEHRDSISKKLLAGLEPDDTATPLRPKPPRKSTAAKPAVKTPASAAPSRAEIRHAKEHARRITAAAAPLGRDHLAHEMERQAELTPRSMQQLHAVHLPEFGSIEESEWTHSPSAWALAYYTGPGGTQAKPEIWFNPQWGSRHDIDELNSTHEHSSQIGWFTPTGTDSGIAGTAAHEYGHHVAEAFFAVGPDGVYNMRGDLAERLLPTLADALGAEPDSTSPWSASPDMLKPQRRADGSFVTSFDDLNEWVLANEGSIGAKVSYYATTNIHELLAEIWQEYSTKGADARPHIKTIGDLIRQLAEEVRA